MPKRAPKKPALARFPRADLRTTPGVVVVDHGREFHSRELLVHFHRLGLNIVYRTPTRPTSKKEI